MANGNEKGIVLRMERGEGEIHLHPDTLNNFLEALPRNEKGWIVLRATINRSLNSRTSHHLQPLKPDYRQTKITGPTQYKTA